MSVMLEHQEVTLERQEEVTDLVVEHEPPEVPTGAEGRVVHTGAEPRLIALSAVRGLMALVAGVAVFADPVLSTAAQQRLASVVGAWLLLAGAAEISRRTGVARSLASRVAPVLDGVLLVAATVAAGGTSSPLFFLAFIHVIAVTLLASYPTGLKVALLDASMLMVAAAAETAGTIPFLEGGDGGQAAAAAIRSVALLIVTVVTAGGSALNERELRLSRAGLETMLGTGQAMMRASQTEDAVQIALSALTGPLDFVAAAAVITPQRGASVVAVCGRESETVQVRTDRDVIVVAPAEPQLRVNPDDLDIPPIAELLVGQRNVIAVPLVGQRSEGVLAAAVGGESRRAGLPVRTVELVRSLAAQLSQTVDSIHLSGEIAELAAMDGLTGVANRRRFDERFEELLAEAAASGEPLAALAIDIDHFKQVNDTSGHQVGDEVLKQVARTLREAERADDFLARYGGEEFAILLPATDLPTAARVAERLRLEVQEAPTLVPVTVSLGVATTDESGFTAEGLFGAADQALYAAKAAGRNRVRTTGGWKAPAPR